MSLASSLDSRQSKESAQYQLALKHYYHRNFSKSLKVLSALLDNPVIKLTMDISNEEWLPSAYKLYVTLCGMALREVKAHELTQMSSPTHRLQFPQYLQSECEPSGKKMADKLVKDMESSEFFKLIYELGLGEDQSCVCCCLETEIEHNVDVEWQIGHILKSQPILQSTDVLRVYLSKSVLPDRGRDAVKDKISRLFALESEQVVEEWLRWADGLQNGSNNESEFDDYSNSDQLLNESDYGYVEDVEHDLVEDEVIAEEKVIPKESSSNLESSKKQNKKNKKKKRPQTTLKVYVIGFFKQHMGIDIAAKYQELVQILTLLGAILAVLVLISTGKKLLRYKALRKTLSRALDTVKMAFKVSYV